jgi:hypothetical protein
MSKRQQLLLELLAQDRPTATILKELADFPWDSERALVKLKRGHVIKVMEGFIAGRLSPADVECWANAVEGREDIGFEAGHGRTVSLTGGVKAAGHDRPQRVKRNTYGLPAGRADGEMAPQNANQSTALRGSFVLNAPLPLIWCPQHEKFAGPLFSGARRPCFRLRP